ncbi:MFS transporter [Paraburkholderia sp. DHOC27]|uniref:MFS transporter n=1 Tax=Paraburkholderia sp. DHOC27 TaxID=2303330 RepID=UPI000E3EBA3B|nr:MFS transporter [Paraburkholderia sp. DHOC27]RFU49178.1 MFS transporter [Paraburkholderia sp. DHOC27]
MDRRLLILALGMFAIGTDSFVVAGVLPEISRSFHTSIGATGQLTTVYALAYAFASPVAAAVFAHVERKRLMLCGLGLFIIANLATAWAPSLAAALAARALAGFGAAMYAPTATGSGASIVSPEQRGFALSVVAAGLTASTALGAPIGTIIGGLGDWRYTMIFVSSISALSALGIITLLTQIPAPPAISLKQRLAPMRDHRVGLTLLTTFFFLCGNFAVYTYLAVIFDRATHGSPVILGALLVLWGTSGTIMNLTAGRLIDRIGTRKILIGMLAVLIVVMSTLSWTSATLPTAIIAIALFGAASWGQLAAQQHRLVTLMPAAATIVLGLNTSAIYTGVALAGLLGAVTVHWVGAHQIGWVSLLLYVGALITAEAAQRSIVNGGARIAVDFP